MKNQIYFFCSTFLVLVTLFNLSDAAAQNSASSAAATSSTLPQAAALNSQTGVFSSPSWDRFEPGWNTSRFKRGLGFSTSTSFVGTGAAVLYDTFIDDQQSISYYFGFNKSVDTLSTTTTNTNSGVATITNSTVTSSSGGKNPYTISLGAAYYKKVFRNEWMYVRFGGYGGLDYYSGISYPVGSRTETVVSSTPTTTSVTETGFGTTDLTRPLVLKFGPVADTFFYFRWFPQLAVGFQTAILYSTENKAKTNTNTRTRSYTIVNGVEQTATSDSTSSVSSESQPGPGISTLALGGTTFSFTGLFTIKYVW